jgi:hypothetical protein
MPACRRCTWQLSRWIGPCNACHPGCTCHPADVQCRSVLLLRGAQGLPCSPADHTWPIQGACAPAPSEGARKRGLLHDVMPRCSRPPEAVGQAEHHALCTQATQGAGSAAAGQWASNWLLAEQLVNLCPARSYAGRPCPPRYGSGCVPPPAEAARLGSCQVLTPVRATRKLTSELGALDQVGSRTPHAPGTPFWASQCPEQHRHLARAGHGAAATAALTVLCGLAM